MVVPGGCDGSGRSPLVWPVVLTMADITYQNGEGWLVEQWTEETSLPADLTLVGHMIEKPERSSLTPSAIWIHDLTSALRAPVRSALSAPARRLCRPRELT